jgi:NADH-quinone oxidoreductase subunit N
MGMPPTGGFLAKVYVFGSALATDKPAMIVLAVIAVVNSAIAAAYYLRIVGACYLARPVGEASSEPAFSLKVGLALCGLLVLALGLGPQNLMRCVGQASRDLQPRGGYQRPALVQDIDQSP